MLLWQLTIYRASMYADLPGDICVRNTLADGSAIYGKERFCVLRSFTASTDGGHAE